MLTTTLSYLLDGDYIALPCDRYSC